MKRRHLFLRNYLAISIEGGFFMGGMAFLSAETVLPVIVESLNGPNWLISLVPSLAPLGFLLPSIISAHWIERMQAVKSFSMTIGIFQRLPYLVAGLALLGLGNDHPGITLTIVVAAPFLSGLIGGIGLSAFFELLARIIPEDRRASNLAIRFIIGGLIGILAGVIVKLVLTEYPGTTGYGILHLIAFTLMMLSFLFFSFIREINKNRSPQTTHRNLLHYFQTMPAFLKSDPYLTRFIAIRCTGIGFLVIIPFLALHVIEVTGADESIVGVLIVFQMLGGLLGNITAGILGDRFGNRLTLRMAKLCFILMSVSILITQSLWGFYAIYFLFGFSFYANNVAASSLMTELAPVARRPTFMGILAFITVPAILLTSGLSALIREYTGSIYPACVAAIVLLAASLVFLQTLVDPRQAFRAHCK
jgi:MFS family permease